MIKEKTIPPQKAKLLWSGFKSSLKPAKYAIVMGNKEREHGPRLVRRPTQKTIKSITGLASASPLRSNDSLLWARSEIARPSSGVVKESFLKQIVLLPYLLTNLRRILFSSKPVDSSEQRISNPEIKRLESREFPP